MSQRLDKEISCTSNAESLARRFNESALRPRQGATPNGLGRASDEGPAARWARRRPISGGYPHQSGFGPSALAPSWGQGAKCPASMPACPTSTPLTERSISRRGRSIRS